MLMLVVSAGAYAQVRNVPLETVSGLTLINAQAEPVTHQGRKGVRITALRRSAAQHEAGRMGK